MYLAHINESHEQTLIDHSETVARLAGIFGGKIGCQNLAELAGLLHDMGKAKEEFQSYLKSGDFSRRGKINHSSAGAAYIYSRYGNSTNIYERLTAQIISIVICSHHSGLIDCIDLTGRDNFTERLFPKNDIHYPESVSGFVHPDIAEKIDTLFSKAVSEVESIGGKVKNKNELPFFLGLICRYILSCVIDADRYDTYCFSISKNTTEDRISADWGILLERIEETINAFPKTTKIDIARREISDACNEFANNASGIYRLNVPTGGGKTLSSLRYAVSSAHIHGASSIFYAIPFTTIIDQNAEVIRKSLKDDEIILEHHSNIIRENSDEYQDEVNKYNLLTERWDTPIILTTTVQMLDTLFLGKTSSVRRFHNLANSILIFDEVQAIPTKTLSMFNSAMNFLSQICGSTIILCTATQPELSILPKPICLSSPSDIITDMSNVYQTFKRVTIKNALRNGGYSAKELAAFVAENTIRNTLIILNTKSAALKLYLELKKIRPDADIFYLSTNLCSKHRLEILDIVIAKLQNPSSPLICVSTQLIEAGVDISFDTVIRSLAGLDSIAQAAGRCNRHGKLKGGAVFLINSNDEKLQMMPEILHGQKQTRRVLYDYENNPAAFDNDLLSPKAIQRYYEYYYGEYQKIEFDYPVMKQEGKYPVDFNLYDLLWRNQKGVQAMAGKPPYILTQAFSTAGDAYKVIDQNTIAVLVPYKEGKTLIRQIRQETDLSKLKSLIRRSQRYAINLFIHENLLEHNGISPINNSGIYVLDEEYYSSEFGFYPHEEIS